MNKNQKIALWIGVAIFLAVTFLPLDTEKRFSLGESSKTTFHRIQPPEIYPYWIAIGVVTGALVISLKESKSGEEK